MDITFEHVNYVDDGGLLAAELVLTAGELVGLVDAHKLLVGNARPDHDIITLKSGKERYRKTTERQKQWTEELLENRAVVGNLTLRLDPDLCDYEIDEEGHRLTLKAGVFDERVDSATRTRAIISAARSAAQTFDLDTRFAVRVWFANEEEADRLFHVYNQRGEKVNDTVAKFTYQSTPHQRIAKALMQQSPHLGIGNVEVQTNTVSANSSKLMAFNTLSQSVESWWSSEPLTEAEEKLDVDYLLDFWNELVVVRPEFGVLPKAERAKLRGSSVAGTAVSIHGVVGLADAMFKTKTPLSELAKLTTPVRVTEAGRADRMVDFFDYDNPLWTQIGVLVSATDAQGNVRKTLRMSFQTRKAAGQALKGQLGL